ncbi:MAG: GDSL family lipase [Candidatus Planktophila sp.]|nr:GDSL family lipase [Candidatus Planktophila sp.]
MSAINVFIGDSVTDCGRDIEPPFGNGYVRNIAQSGKLAGEIINVGTSGHRLIDLEKRWQADVLDHKPTLVSIAIGINDTWRRYDDNDITTIEDFSDRYHRLLMLTKKTCNPQFVLCEPFLLPVEEEMNTWREDLNPKIALVHQMARVFDAILVPFDAYLHDMGKIVSVSKIAEDGIHPTIFGHQEMAKVWLNCVNGPVR